MKNVILSTAFILLISPLANAQTVTLSGDAAVSFINRHFPNASIPGTVEGVFHYINRNGAEKPGYAQCFVPAMGESSDGVVPSCTVEY